MTTIFSQVGSLLGRPNGKTSSLKVLRVGGHRRHDFSSDRSWVDGVSFIWIDMAQLKVNHRLQVIQWKWPFGPPLFGGHDSLRHWFRVTWNSPSQKRSQSHFHPWNADSFSQKIHREVNMLVHTLGWFVEILWIPVWELMLITADVLPPWYDGNPEHGDMIFSVTDFCIFGCLETVGPFVGWERGKSFYLSGFCYGQIQNLVLSMIHFIYASRWTWSVKLYMTHHLYRSFLLEHIFQKSLPL